MEIVVLGCGASTGVPMLGLGWGRCDPNNPKNRRTRVSLLIKNGEDNIILDTSPDIREQLFRENITKVDAIVYTHYHADHVSGIDELRSLYFSNKQTIDIYGDQATLDEIKSRYHYLFSREKYDPTYKGFLIPHLIEGDFTLRGINFKTFYQEHGNINSLGFRIGNFAYSTDARNLDENAFKVLEGIDTWIVDCLKREEAPSHSHLARTLSWIERVKPKRAFLTHMDLSMDYDELSNELKNAVTGVEIRPCYDGMQLLTTA